METSLLILLYSITFKNNPCKGPMCPSAFSAILVREGPQKGFHYFSGS